ncbi:hypothetical protein Gmet_3002 [Geobacter metallireducens GS-15]|uniref:Lipoprotein n=1 Tax=Geobacter metallireducens (strain ATCC 53774 / DSM 7210 / GS-15) TaxID=269799 RepID=Q39RA7_GEOMG|nr:hypothetical protein [Geobacter metallireducens]ABB33217.1 hypothetical protein Gmet_3002 [Geobacter metallireducens GS-15]
MKMKKILNISNTFTWILISILVLIGLSACCPPFCINQNGDTKNPYVFAYVDTSWNLRFRWSDDGTTWSAAAGTPQNVDFAPGIDTDDVGIYLAIFKASGSYPVRVLRGLYNSWDNTPRTVGDGHPNEIHSGTSIVHIEGEKWLVAYNHYNQAKVVIYDNSYPQDFKAEVTPVSGVAANNNLIDKPALVNRNGKIIVSWLMNNQLQMVTGDIQGGNPVWQPGYLFSANVPEQGFGPPIGAHALARDRQRFYVAVVRQRDPLPGEQISHYFLFIYTSDNGLNWARLTYRETRNPQSMSIAARGTNDIIVILSSPIVTGPANSYRFDGSNWTVLDNSMVFGSYPINAGHDFTLYLRY